MSLSASCRSHWPAFVCLVSVDSPGGGSGKDAVEEEGVARTTRTEKTSDGGRTTTTTTTTTHKTKGYFTHRPPLQQYSLYHCY